MTASDDLGDSLMVKQLGVGRNPLGQEDSRSIRPSPNDLQSAWWAVGRSPFHQLSHPRRFQNGERARIIHRSVLHE